MNKNPYEKDIDIPDFVEQENDNEEIEEYEEESRHRKLKTKSLVVIAGILLVVLLIAAIAGWIYGIGQHKAYTKINEEYTTLKTNYDNQVTENDKLKSQLLTVEKELEEYKKPEVTNPETGNNDKTGVGIYKIEVGVNIRDSASTSGKIIDTYDYGTEVKVLEIITSGDMKWGKTEKGYFCIKNGNEDYAIKQD